MYNSYQQNLIATENQLYKEKNLMIRKFAVTTIVSYSVASFISESTEHIFCIKSFRHNVVRITTLNNCVFKTINDLDTPCIAGARIEAGVLPALPTQGPEKPGEVPGGGTRVRDRHSEVALSRLAIGQSAIISLSSNRDIPKLSCTYN